MRRSWILAAVLGLFLLAAVLFLGLPSISPPRRAAPAAVSSASPPPQHEGNRLLYLRGTHLISRRVGSRIEHEVADLHSREAAASPAGSWIAYVVPKGGAASSGPVDFLPRPELHLWNPASGAKVELGPGFGPLWKGDGTEVAYLVPHRPRRCDGETCGGSVRVMVVAPGAAPHPVTAPGHLRLLGWSGDRVLVSNEADLSSTLSLGPSGSPPIRVPVPPSELWDASPSGRWLLMVAPGGFAFQALGDGSPTGKPRRFTTGHVTLSDGAWDPRSRSVAAVLRDNRGRARLALLSHRSGAKYVARSEGAAGNLVWDPSGTRFAYVAVDAQSRDRLQAIVCRVISGVPVICRPWFSWTRGVRLLALTSS